MRYVAIIEKGVDTFGAYVPDFPGCVAAGETRDEVVRLIQEAIHLHLEALKDEGLPIPAPSSTIEFINVAA
jgi:predicted RNase H-like HicB family nuclease